MKSPSKKKRSGNGKSIKTNPILDAIEGKGKEIGGRLAGYSAPCGDDDRLKLCHDLSLKSYTLINKSDIIAHRYIDEEEALVEVFLAENTEVEEVLHHIIKHDGAGLPDHYHRIPNHDHIDNWNDARVPDWRSNVELPGNLRPTKECLDHCRDEIRANACNFTLLPGPNNTLRVILSREGAINLRNCLRRCGVMGGYLNYYFNIIRADLETDLSEPRP